MKPLDRRARIAEIIHEQGEMSVEALASAFDVSLETIRRDLGQLAEDGRLRKFHGGARRIRLHTEGSFQERMNEDAEAKRVIARKVTGLVETGDTIFIDTGSTTLVCAETLSRVGKLTVITNSVRIAQVFGAAAADHTVYLLGGTFSADNAETGGPLVLGQIQEFQADHALITVAAIDPDGGAMDSDFDEAQVARAMIGHSRHVFVLASRAKFARKAAFRVCRLDEIDVVVSDGPPPPEICSAMSAADVELR
jgi:DeoR family glycerol-3-phosphate regulon repressor